MAGSHKADGRGMQQLVLFPQRVLERIEREGKRHLWKNLVEVKLENGVTLHLSLATLHLLRRPFPPRPPAPANHGEMAW